MSYRTVFFAIAAIGGLVVNAPSVQAQAQAQNVVTEINRMRMNIQETERLNQEQITRVNGNITQMSENINAIVVQMNAITEKVKELEARNKQLEADLAMAKKQLQTESVARQESMKKFATEVSKELSATAKASAPPVQAAPAAAPVATPAASGADNGGEFLEYTVQKGATLSIIAKAYKVTIADIRKANNLGNDAVLRVGQKILIPKK